MEITFRLSDDIIQQLRRLPNPDQFVGEVLQKALRDTSFHKESSKVQPSKWAKLVQRIDEHPGGFNGYSAQLQHDMQEFRGNFALGQDTEHELYISKR